MGMHFALYNNLSTVRLQLAGVHCVECFPANIVTAVIRINIFGRFEDPCMNLTVGDVLEVKP
jgi:hypothetical protein